MDEQLTPQDARDELQDPVFDTSSPDDAVQLLKIWDRFWSRVTKLGLGDITLRIGSALVTIGLVGLVIWVMNSFFVPSEKVSAEAEPLELASAGGPVELPAYEGVAPVQGLSPLADTETQADVQTRSRYDFESYKVVSGDTIFDIAASFGLTPETILWTNWGILQDNPAAIYPGQELTIPPVDGVTYIWNEGDGLNGVAKGLSVTPEDILNWPGNNLSAETIGDYALPNITPGTQIFAPGGSRYFFDWTAAIFTREETAESNVWGEGKCAPTNLGPVGSGTYIWPSIERRISGYDFTPDVNHWGVDIAGDTGNPIYAVDNGVVVYAGWNDWGYGNVVAVDHGNGIQTLYAHLDSLNVNCGAFVYQNDVIAYMGSTGNSSGAHLHFEIMNGSQRLNPHNYIGY